MKTARLTTWLTILVMMPCSVAWSAYVRAQLDENLQKVVTAVSSGQDVPVIIHLVERADLQAVRALGRKERRKVMIGQLRSVANRSQHALRIHLQRHGIVQVKSFWAVNAVAASIPAGMITELAARPEVASIIHDASFALPQPLPAALPVETNIALVGAPALWVRGIRGEGTVVATVDSGADILHADLGPRWRGGDNSWYDPNGEHPQAPYDYHGHGSGVLGVLVGGSSTGSVIGVAPGAQWIATKIFNDVGVASYSGIYSAFQWLIDPDGNPATDDAPDVVNNSWVLYDNPDACYPFMTGLLELFDLFRLADISMVFAAGNYGPQAATSISPANFPGTFVVGSIGTALSQTEVSDFSSRGPSACDGATYPDLVAPGYEVRTADRTFGGTDLLATQVGSGTSYAAPVVSGIIALLRGAFPMVPVPVLENVLKRTAQDVDVAGPDNASGYGLVSATRAFAALNALPGIVGSYAAGLWSMDANGNGRWDGVAGGDERFRFGTAQMLPVIGDWDGDGILDAGTFTGGKWFLDSNGSRTMNAGDSVFRFGLDGDVPVAGDWNGDGITEAGVFRQGKWILDGNGSRLRDAGDLFFRFGTADDIPVVGDWNGDGISDAGIFRSGAWILDVNGNHARDPEDLVFRYGQEGDWPVTGDWNGDGNLEIGIFSKGHWTLDADGNHKMGAGDLLFNFGTADRLPVTSR